MIMAYGFYKLYYGIREQKYVVDTDGAADTWNMSSGFPGSIRALIYQANWAINRC